MVGKDDTLFATADGVVMYDIVQGRKRVNRLPLRRRRTRSPLRRA